VKTLIRALHIIWVSSRYRLQRLLPADVQRHWLLRLGNCIPAHADLAAIPAQQHLRLALQQLGPLFIKLGQLLSTRRELLPAELADDLSQLQDQVPGFDSQIAIRIIETELKKSLPQLFASFDITPLAAASLAQVHAATLLDGSQVVVKILRPGIERTINTDIALLLKMAAFLENRFGELKRLHLLQVIQQYRHILLGEVDLVLESAQTQQFQHNFQDSQDLLVPKIYTELSRKRVLTMQRMFGVPISHKAQLQAAGVDLSQLAKTGVHVFLKQVFTDNFFHADMHPGNVHIDISNPKAPKYISLDNAIVGHLSPRDQLLLARQLVALFRQDYQHLAQLMIQAKWVPSSTPTHQFAATLRAICNPILNKPLAEINFAPILIQLFQAAQRYDMQSLPQFALLEKTLIHIEGLGKQLDPHLDIWPIARPLIENWVHERLNPMALLSQTLKQLPDWWLENMPPFRESIL
jgi:ubiquinone biosynthesis protein